MDIIAAESGSQRQDQSRAGTLPLVIFQHVQRVNFTIVNIIFLPRVAAADKPAHLTGFFSNIAKGLFAPGFI